MCTCTKDKMCDYHRKRAEAKREEDRCFMCDGPWASGHKCGGKK